MQVIDFYKDDGISKKGSQPRHANRISGMPRRCSIGNKLFINKILKTPSDSGFTIVENMCALTILGVVFAYALPMYFYCRLRIENAQRRSESTIVIQRIITDLDTRKISTLPTTGTENLTNLLAAGRKYTADITYCPTIAGASGCRTNYRQVQIKISYNGIPTYTIQTAFSDTY